MRRHPRRLPDGRAARVRRLRRRDGRAVRRLPGRRGWVEPGRDAPNRPGCEGNLTFLIHASALIDQSNKQRRTAGTNESVAKLRLRLQDAAIYVRCDAMRSCATETMKPFLLSSADRSENLPR